MVLELSVETLKAQLKAVLILIFLEDGLGVKFYHYEKQRKKQVLILIFLEDGLGVEKLDGYSIKKTGLNPYFLGRWSWRATNTHYCKSTTCITKPQTFLRLYYFSCTFQAE